MRLITTTWLSVDGVMQGIGGPEEDRSGGFDRGGWDTTYFDEDVQAFLGDVYGRTNAFLFGRRPTRSSPAPGASCRTRKTARTPGRCTASPSASCPAPCAIRGGGARRSSGRPVDAVRELKAGCDGELHVPGTGRLLRLLLEHGLVDELNLMICPVVIGRGVRLFPEDNPDVALELAASHVTPSGVTLQTLRPAGRPRYETAGA